MKHNTEIISHNNQKKIAVINDISGFGRCSITVALPIISHMKLQCCPLPTSILSNHTGYDHFFFEDYTKNMREFMKNWKQLGLTFDGIATGFLGSKEQIRIVEEFIMEFRTEATKVIIDPVMGDNGELYSTYTKAMQEEMKHLAACADILTPNLTEACFLTGTPYKEQGWKRDELYEIAQKMNALGAKNIVISGIVMGDYLGNVVYEAETQQTKSVIRTRRIAAERAGTGDVFSSILAADAVNGVILTDSVRKAARFIQDCMRVTDQRRIPPEDGVCFEELLYKLKVR
ncbi:MAG: pyridoxamine kinase [Lachnospiraceae bacterium]|nr:pyridoxamine kinase [Lachnospiraceae bacterium]